MNSHKVFGILFAILLPMIFLQSVNSAARPIRPIRDFIDYNAREDGDQLIGLPSAPKPTYVRPDTGRPQAVDAVRGGRRTPQKGLLASDPNLMFRDESSPGGRRGF